MKNKKSYEGYVGNIINGLESESIPVKKKKDNRELPSDVDSVDRLIEKQPLKKVRPQKKIKKLEQP